MRLVNDREEQTNSTEVGFLPFFTYVLMVSLGVASFLLAPVPMILSHIRLLEPWSKIAIVAGALVALIIFELPVSVVLLVFVFGLYLSDAIHRKSLSVFGAIGSASFVVLVAFIVLLLAQASIEGTNLVVYWNSCVASFVQEIKSFVQFDAPIEWDLVQKTLFYEGPFLLVSGALISSWVSIGLCAHAQWVGDKNPYISSALRKLRPSVLVSAIFVITVVASRAISTEIQHLFCGVARVVAALLFVQGTIVLSSWMAAKQVRSPFRAVFYSLFVLLGFYALIGIGFFSPFFLRKKTVNLISEKGFLKNREEAI